MNSSSKCDRRRSILGFRSSLSVATLLLLAIGCAETPVSLEGPGNVLMPPVLSHVPADDGVETFTLPSFDDDIPAVDLCSVFGGLCVDSCEEDPDAFGPTDDRRGFGFKLSGCGQITTLRLVSGHFKFAGHIDLVADATLGDLGLDPGCLEKTITIPEVPAIPAIPALRNPFTGAIIWPGRPGRPAVPARTVTIRIPEGCDPVRAPSANLIPPALHSLGMALSADVAATMVIEVAGTGEVELRIPIPGINLSAKKKIRVFKLIANSDLVKTEPAIGAGVGLYAVIRGRLSETGARLTISYEDAHRVDWTLGENLGENLGGKRGWITGPVAPVSSEASASVVVDRPDGAEIRYGAQVAIGAIWVAGPPHDNGRPIAPQFATPVFVVDFGAWLQRYGENIFTVDAAGNLKNESNLGWAGSVYAGFAPLLADDFGVFRGTVPCTVDNIEECNAADFFRSFDCCVADMLDQWGYGVFDFRTTTTGTNLDPDGYTLEWTRASTTPEPHVDSVVTRNIGTNGTLVYPDPGDSWKLGNVIQNPFGPITDFTCTKLYSDIVIGTTGVIPELRRQGFDIPQFTKIFGCQQAPGQYQLTVSGLSSHCTLAGPNPRTVELLPLIRWDQGIFTGGDLEDLGGFTEVELNVHCNHPPVADAGANQMVECTAPGGGASVTLDASGSSDLDGDALTYTCM